MKTFTLKIVRVESEIPHPWTPGIHRFRSGDAWLFQTKLDDARRLAWDEYARGSRWLRWVGGRS
jgi:hypothetical protein